ncbi:MAG: sulfide/dihydroorotate dehydrogenase-like FAD/NAD-binding protein [Pseudomonadota bacterium]
MDTTATVIEKRRLTDVTTLFVIHAPLVARNAAPGQFVILRVTETGERVPISLTDFDREAGTITLVVQVVGRTTALVCALEEGDEVLDVAGPLGRPVELPEGGHAVLIGGGFGAGAIYPLARELRDRGVRVSAIVGARTQGLVILRDLLESVCDAFHPCTDDGSLGYRGFVTGRLEELLSRGAGYTCCFAVGPMPMMRAVADAATRWRLPAMVSLDPLMIDGTGMCGGCRVTVGGVTRFACVDGPFFPADEIDFDEAADRKAMYAEDERIACERAATRVGA